MPTTVKELAEQIKQAPELDPITISTIISVLLFLFQNCILKKKDIDHPTLWQRWRLRQIAYKADRDNWKPLYRALLSAAPSVSDSQLRALSTDAKSYPKHTL